MRSSSQPLPHWGSSVQGWLRWRFLEEAQQQRSQLHCWPASGQAGPSPAFAAVAAAEGSCPVDLAAAEQSSEAVPVTVAAGLEERPVAVGAAALGALPEAFAGAAAVAVLLLQEALAGRVVAGFVGEVGAGHCVGAAFAPREGTVPWQLDSGYLQLPWESGAGSDPSAVAAVGLQLPPLP